VALASQLRVPASDFAAQWADISADALGAIERVGRSGRWILGDEVASFEAEFAAWWGVPHAVGVASGLDALEIALRCAGIGSGDRVLTTPLTAFATTLAILRAGADPVWCDVDESGSLSLAAAAAALGADPGIRAVVPVHLYGHPVDPGGLAALAEDHGVVVVEDCAQSAGARRDGRPTGLVGAVAATSLYPTKNLGALGDGGVVLAADAEIAAQARRLRDYGRDAEGAHVEPGLNSRLDELHAAVLRSALLPRLDGYVARRAAIATRYADGLSGSRIRPIAAAGGASSHHLMPVGSLDANAGALRAALTAAGIAAGRHYPRLCSDQQAAGSRGRCADELTTARRIAEHETSLPLHPYLDDAAVDLVIEVCRTVAG
jgi:dTDP-3-amino-3,4,6-trideoxy-alpha-D-glucose transaminase